MGVGCDGVCVMMCVGCVGGRDDDVWDDGVYDDGVCVGARG